MQAYQEKYIQNTREISELSIFYRGSDHGFEEWMREQEEAAARCARLRQENIALLSDHLFPALDDLYNAGEETIAELSEFAGILMDWSSNLDPGVYVIIHDALLSYYRYKKDRNRIIRELYMLGMGLYYSRRFPEGVGSETNLRFAFRNEMVFTEASSYLRYFDDIDDTETRGYIIRALHNITLCIKVPKRRIAANARAMNVMKDPHYREVEPNLPWDRFIRASHQQMSINHTGLSGGDLTQDEIALVLDSCYEVFKPEEHVADQNIRWLWPYYDMEFNCGYVDLETTVSRIEHMIESTLEDQYDQSGLYANIQLPVVYGQFMDRYPQMQTDEKRLRFLDHAYARMMRVLLACPPDKFDDYFFYMVDLVISSYYEIAGSLPYREVAEKIMRRFSGNLYIRSRKAGRIMQLISEAALAGDAAFFDDIPFIAQITDPAEKHGMIMNYASECGFFMDFGMVKMNVQKTLQSRQLFEDENEVYMLHTESGYNDLKRHRTTEIYADVALGHHSWYSGSGGYPDKYVRNESAYRQMTDIAAAVTYMLEEWNGDTGALMDSLYGCPRGRFSPVVLSCLTDAGLQERIGEVLRDSGREYYREIYDELVR